MQVISKLVSLFQTPAIFISLIACIGLIIQKKCFSDIIKGTFKAMLGIIVLLKGVDIISASMAPLATAVSALFPVSTAGQNLADYGTFIAESGSGIGIVMVLGFVLNVLLVRFTPLKAVYLTGHMMFFYAMLWLAVGVEGGLSGGLLIGFAVVCYLISTTILPHFLIKEVEYLTGSRNFTVGHSATLFCLMGSWVGRLVGDKKKSAEDFRFPAKLDFLRDTTLTAGFIMIIVYAIVAVMVPGDVRSSVYGTEIFTFVLTQGMSFAAGMLVLLQGARLMMAEIVPAFKGISDKVVPGAVPALDIPMVFPYGPNSLMLGFTITLVTSLATMFIINTSGFSVYAVLPATIACYFDVAPGAIFANARGGRTAVVVWSVLGGILMMVLVSLAMPMVASTVGTFVQQMGANEESVWILLFRPAANLLGGIVG